MAGRDGTCVSVLLWAEGLPVTSALFLLRKIVTLLRPHRDNGRKRPSLREWEQEGSEDPEPGPAGRPHGASTLRRLR